MALRKRPNRPFSRAWPDTDLSFALCKNAKQPRQANRQKTHLRMLHGPAVGNKTCPYYSTPTKHRLRKQTAWRSYDNTCLSKEWYTNTNSDTGETIKDMIRRSRCAANLAIYLTVMWLASMVSCRSTCARRRGTCSRRRGSPPCGRRACSCSPSRMPHGTCGFETRSACASPLPPSSSPFLQVKHPARPSEINHEQI